jgi:roundabout, axon guidance receptor 2
MPLHRVKVLDDRSLRLDNVILGDEGEYTCEADNSVGAVSASGYLTVYGKYYSSKFIELFRVYV